MYLHDCFIFSKYSTEKKYKFCHKRTFCCWALLAQTNPKIGCWALMVNNWRSSENKYSNDKHVFFCISESPEIFTSDTNIPPQMSSYTDISPSLTLICNVSGLQTDSKPDFWWTLPDESRVSGSTIVLKTHLARQPGVYTCFVNRTFNGQHFITSTSMHFDTGKYL